MALAILEFLEHEKDALRFRMDTGTNPFYQLRAGTGVSRDRGIELVEEVYFTTPLARGRTGGDLLGSAQEVSLPARQLDRRNTYVQLFSYKTPNRISPAFSRAVRVPVAFSLPARGTNEYGTSFSGPPAMMPATYREARRIPHRPAHLATQASMDELLGAVLKLASPIVGDLLKNGTPSSGGNGAGKDGTAGTGTGKGQGAATGKGDDAAAELVAHLLQAVLGGVRELASPLFSTPKSVSTASIAGNRFTHSGPTLARPFIFGVDDALIASLIGPLVQVLPQLANAANQKRVQLKQADNALVAGILSDINKRLMMDKLAELQQRGQEKTALDPAVMNQLLEILKQAPPATQPGPAGQPTRTAGQSSLSSPMSSPSPPMASLSNRAALTILTGDPVSYNGGKAVLFSRKQNVVLNVRLDVREPAPKTPLPKAILKLVLQDSANPATRFEKVFRQKGVSAGAVLECVFPAGELAHLPVGTPVSVTAELRWPRSGSGGESRALGSTEIVLTNQYFLLSQGEAAGEEVELRDMKRYRPFWNKVWEAPVLDAASESNGRKKYTWELDANARYTVLLSAANQANGLMETKLLQGPPDPDSLTHRTEGRMKAGIELSVSELNKLLPLWNDTPPLDPDRLEAFGAAGFLKKSAGEFQTRLRLKGKAGQRGLIWVAPVFKLFTFTLGGVEKTDENGQVVATSRAELHFPLPVAARVIGLTSQRY